MAQSSHDGVMYRGDVGPLRQCFMISERDAIAGTGLDGAVASATSSMAGDVSASRWV